VNRRALPRRPGLVIGLLLLGTAAVWADTWQLTAPAQRSVVTADLAYEQRRIGRSGETASVPIHLAFFSSRAFRLAVVDLGDGPAPQFPSLPDAFRAIGAAAGVNGGFFHPDWRPLGLVIAEGERINHLEQAKLLSGVLYSDARGIHLVRRARFQEPTGVTALLQTGPYLVEHGQRVRGLAEINPRRRTFIATDWRGHWVLGATQAPLTLADLAAALASPGTLTPWPVDRAINLDGGSSTGFFFERGAGQPAITLAPWKRVRTLLGIVPR
jgi:hypothetical protein